MSLNRLYLVRASALPPVFIKVVRAKQLLADGQARSVSDAVKQCGISRSAYYKYKDCVFPYDEEIGGRIVSARVVLRDHPGVLTNLLAELSQRGANILTLYQSAPMDGTASVRISADISRVNSSVQDVFKTIRTLDGVLAVSGLQGDTGDESDDIMKKGLPQTTGQG